MLKKKFQKYTLVFSVVFFGTLFFAGTVGADTACNGLPDGKDCKLDVDSKSFTPGKCKNQTCVASDSALTTPQTGPGSAGQAVDYIVPGTTTEKSRFITCGRPGQSMCTLCNLIEGLNNVIRYIESIAIGVGLLSFTIAGVMYILSAGDTKQIGQAKDIMKNATIGFVIIFAAWVIVNTAITSIGTYSDLGMNITSWGEFECAARVR